jgi:hypothetical protein
MFFTDEQQEALKAKSRYLQVRTRPNLLPLGGTARFVKVTDGELRPLQRPPLVATKRWELAREIRKDHRQFLRFSRRRGHYE